MELILEHQLDTYMNYITESNNILDIYITEGKEIDKGIEKTNKNAIQRVIDMLIGVCSKAKQVISTFIDKVFGTKQTKLVTDAYTKKANSDQSLKNNKFSIFNIRNRNLEYNKALRAIDVAERKGDITSLDDISDILTKNIDKVVATITVVSGLALLANTSGIVDSIKSGIDSEEKRLKRLAKEEKSDRAKTEKELKFSKKKLSILEKQLKDNTDYHTLTLKTAMRLMGNKGTDQDKAVAANWAADKIDKGGITGKVVQKQIAKAAGEKASVLGSGVKNTVTKTVANNPKATSTVLKASAATLQAKDIHNKASAISKEISDKNAK